MNMELTRIFVKVIQQGSFSRAAELLKLPKSTVSKSVARLESETGTKLLLRTTRSLTLTPTGRVFYETCLGPIQTVEDAQKFLQGKDSALNGHMRITAPEDLGNHVISAAIGRLTKLHSGLTFELNYTDEVVDLIRDGYDLAVRLGQLSPSSFKVRKLGDVRMVMVASRGYLKSVKDIRDPDDLAELDCLAYNSREFQQWSLRSITSRGRVNVRTRIMSNQMTSLVRMATAGAGVALVPDYLCASEIKEGKLVQVLSQWTGISYPVAMVSPLASSTSARLKLVGDSLAKEISAVLA